MTSNANIETFVYTPESPAGIKPVLCLLGALIGFGLGGILFLLALIFRLGAGEPQGLVLKRTWDRLPSTGTVPIRYLPNDPEFNRIMEGEEDAKSEKGTERILIGLVGVIFMGGLFTVGGIMQLMGIDISLDEKKGRIRIKRLDEFTGTNAKS